MKEKLVRWILAAVAAALCGLFAWGLLAYTQPMEDQVYNLSLFWEGEAMPEDWVFSDKGWTVFTQEGEDRRVLTPDQLGNYTGLTEPGQTIYFSRVLQEDLDAPTLQIGAMESAIAVFLDGTLLYADFEQESMAIGSLRLPLLEGYRAEPVTISLPMDYQGKTLTIAQGTYPYEGVAAEDITVYPAEVSLFCGYAYESGLIAQSFQTAVPAALAYGGGLVLLALLVWQAFRGRRDLGLLWAALALFFWMTEMLGSAPFFYSYFGGSQFDLAGLARLLALAALLAFLSARARRRRWVLWGLTGLYTLSVALRLVLSLWPSPPANDLTAFLTVNLPVLLGFVALVAALVLGVLLWRRETFFYRLFVPLTAAVLLLMLAVTIARGQGLAVLEHAVSTLSMLLPGYLLWPLMNGALVAAVVAAVAEGISQEIARRTETQAMADRERMALASYESLSRQHQEILMLRHDMTKQLLALQAMVTDPQALAYLESVVGRVNQVRKVADTGNQMLDILLNSCLPEAQDAGIAVEIQRSQAPETLPLSDTELCSLILNILDNAVAGAQAPGVARPYLRLDLHIQNDFFVFVCENAATRAWMEKEPKKEPMQLHGLGTKIMEQIMARYGNLLRREKGEDFYRVTLAIPFSPGDSPEAFDGPPPSADG